MKIICTYCSANKDRQKIKLPAIDRYDSLRIKSLYKFAQEAHLDFYILSGKYGLLEASELIPYYDHLLNAKELEQHIDKVHKQLLIKEITFVEYYSRDLTLDPHLSTYLNCIKLACKKAAINFKLKIL